jgi:hypothetical protein
VEDRRHGPDACRAAREYLATLDDAAFGAASDSIPKFVSPSDPAAQWTGALKGHAFFAYATNYLSTSTTRSLSMWRRPAQSGRQRSEPHRACSSGRQMTQPPFI